MASVALGIDKDLIIRFRNILIAINSQRPLNVYRISLYCKETYLLYLNNYSWYKIPATVHKVLAHIGDIILHTPVPVGSVGEECVEARHKLFRKDREHHARKSSREHNITDIFMRAIYTSDPHIS